MADMNYSIAVDASQAIQSTGKLTNALKHLDSAFGPLNKAVGTTAKILKKDFTAASKDMTSATALLSQSFAAFKSSMDAHLQGVGTSIKSTRTILSDLKKDFQSSTSVISSTSSVFDAAYKKADLLEAHLVKLSKQAHISKKDLAKLSQYQAEFEKAKGKVSATSGKVADASANLGATGVQRMLDAQSQIRGINIEIQKAVKDYNLLQQETKELIEWTGLLGDTLFDLRHKLETTTKGSAQYKKLAESLDIAERAYTQLNTKIDSNQKKMDNLERTIEKSKIQYNSLFRTFGKNQNHFEVAETALAKYNAEMKELLQLENRLVQKTEEVNSKLAAQNQVTAQANLISSMTYGTVPTKFNTKNSLVKVGAEDEVSALMSITKAARSALYGINAVRIAFNLAFAASGINAATRVVASFDQTLADLSSTVRDVTVSNIQMDYQMGALKSTMEELGATSRYTTTEAGQGMIYMAQAGLSASEIVQAASAVLDLAVASNTSLSRSSDIVIQTMRTFSIQASEAWKVTDTLAVGAKESVTSIEQLAEALKYVGPVAHTMGVQVNTVVAALGTLSDSGLQASMAGTGLRRIISEIVNPTYKARNILEAVGLTMDKLDIQSHGLVQVLRNIKEANLSVGQSFAIWGDRGTPALQTIMANFDEFERKLEKMKFSAPGFRGAANRMRTEREDTLSGQFLAAKSAVQEFLIKFSEYTNAIDTGKNVLQYFAETLRMFNTDIGTGLSGLAKWISALVAAGVTIRKVHSPITQTAGALTSLRSAFQNFLKTPYNWAIGVQLSHQLTYLNATAATTPGILAKVQFSLATLVAESKMAAVAVGVLSKALGLLGSLAMGALSALVVGGIVSFITETDRATDAVARLKQATDMYFFESAKTGRTAVDVMREYAASLKSVGIAALEIRKVGLQRDISALVESFRDENIYGGMLLGDYEIGKVLFGKNADQLKQMLKTKEGLHELESLVQSYEVFGIGGTKAPDIIKSPFTSDMTVRANDFVTKLRTAIVAAREWMAITDEITNRQAEQKKQAEEQSALLKFSEEAGNAYTALTRFSQAVRESNQKELVAGLDKASNKLYELQHQFSTTEANELFATFSKAIPNFVDFFDFDPGTFEVQLKKNWEEILRLFAKEQKALTDKGEIKIDFLKQLGFDEETFAKTLALPKQVAASYRALQKAIFENKLFNYNAQTALRESLVSEGDAGKYITNELTNIFKAEDLNNLTIRVTDTFEEVQIKEGHLSDATELLAQRVKASIAVLRESFNSLKTIKFAEFIKNQQILDRIPKDVRKNVTGFASASGLSVSDYDPVAGKWKAVGNFNASQVNSAYDDWVAGKTKEKDPTSDINRRAKALRKLANEQEELRLKHRQYVAEVTLGSTAEVDLAKLRLEKQKEINSVMETAASLNLTAKDAEIAKTLKQIELTYALKEAEAQRALQNERSTSPLQYRVTSTQAIGVSALPQEIMLDKQKVANLYDEIQGVQVESTKWYTLMGQIDTINGDIYHKQLNFNEELLNGQLAYAQQFGTVSQIRNLQGQLIQLQIEKLQWQLMDNNLTKEQTEELQRQLNLKQKEKTKAEDKNPVTAVKDQIRAMDESMTTYQLFADTTAAAIDGLSTHLVDFFETGKFELSSFTRELGRTILEMTTKMLIVKALGAFMFGDGGVANVTTFANGGIANINRGVKKFASGGMLTGPTFFNTSSGLALAGEAGYEHMMPAARLSNGKWGVYAEGMGGTTNQTIVLNNTVNVEGGATGNKEDDDRLARTISERMSDAVKTAVQRELAVQMRAGGMLNSNGNKRW